MVSGEKDLKVPCLRCKGTGKEPTKGTAQMPCIRCNGGRYEGSQREC